jgi:glutaredoxin
MPWRGWQWLWKRRPIRRPEVVLYTRQSCPLCDEAKTFLEVDKRRGRITLSIQDVDGSPELQSQWGDWVPVVVVDGRVRFRGRIQPVLWRRLLRDW